MKQTQNRQGFDFRFDYRQHGHEIKQKLLRMIHKDIYETIYFLKRIFLIETNSLLCSKNQTFITVTHTLVHVYKLHYLTWKPEKTHLKLNIQSSIPFLF